ncbi:MAG: acyltransferase [Chitinophagaceae bacterium]|nr:acyltransferase [Chitinophagaceae bacterium]
MNPPPTKRIYGLDILRAAAILFVIQSHGLVFVRPHLKPDTLHAYWLFILDGVDLFFVLSGFLIGGILLRIMDGTGLGWKQLTGFWVRRWFRTLPNYFLVLLFLLAAYFYAYDAFPERFLHFFLFIQNFNSPHPDFFPEAWSLSVEEWFYLLIPLGLFLLSRVSKYKREVLLGWIVFILVTVTFYRIYKSHTHSYMLEGTWDMNIRKQVLTRLDSIMYGILGAYLSQYYYQAWTRHKNTLLIAGLVILFGSRALGSVNSLYYEYFYLTFQSIGTFLLLPKLQTISRGKGVLYKAITFISVISYSMYLLHLTVVLKIFMPPLLAWMGLVIGSHWLVSGLCYLLYLSITIGLSYLLYTFFERPIMMLREKYKPRKNIAVEQ